MKYLLLLAITYCTCIAAHSQIVNVSTAIQLRDALNNALPGHTIVLADGVYDLPSGIFLPPIGLDGTSTQPITVKGSRNAILTTGTHTTGYAFQFKGNKHWILKGFTVRNCKNGVMVDSSQYITVDSIQSLYTGQSGINLRRYSSYCTVQNCYVDSAGILDPAVGEGIYVGSAFGNWCENTYCNIDTCNYNKILNNSFGSYIRAENIDIKEGTKYGLVRGNQLNGNGLANINGGDSWIDVKGNYWTIELNTGNNSYLDGFQTHIQQPGWGNYNTFNQNTLNVNANGYGIRITTSNANGTALNNVVCNSNVVTGAALGLTNIAQQTCSTVLSNTLLQWNVQQQSSNTLFSWKVSAISELSNFVIEQSIDGQNFTKLTHIDISGLAYNVSISQQQIIGNYFRLSFKKKDGVVFHSSIIHLAATVAKEVKLYRNGNALVLHNPFAQATTIKLLNSQGQVLLQQNLVQGFNYIYPTSLANGIYVLQVVSSHQSQNQLIKFLW